MKTSSKFQKPKGLSVEGFWRQMQDKTGKPDNETSSMETHDASIGRTDSYEWPETNDNWEARFEAWLDRL